MSYEHVIRAAARMPWALMPEKLSEIEAFLELKMAGQVIPYEAAAAPRVSRQADGQIAVLPIYGVIAPKMNMMTDMSGGTSIDQLTKDFRQAVADPQVTGILLDVDSPGGSVEGLEELAAEIRQARGSKAIAAVSNHLMASAAYYLGSAAGEVASTPSALTGSIGVRAMHLDVSARNAAEGVTPTLITAGKYKGEGDENFPLTDEGRAEIQKQADYYYGLFVNAVAAGRGVSASAVRDGFGQGRVLNAKDAVAQGMVDRVATFDQMVARLSSAQIRGQMRSRGNSALHGSHTHSLAGSITTGRDLLAATEERELDPSIPSDPQPGEIADQDAYDRAVADGSLTPIETPSDADTTEAEALFLRASI